MTLIPPPDLYAIWPWIRDGLVTCALKTGERWRPEDVFVMIHAKTAFVYVAENNAGFIVAQRMFDPDGPVLFVFAMWGEGIMARKDEYYQALADLGKSIGAKRLRMQSSRKAWEQEDFFHPVAVIYEHELEPT